jgi:hypothetical protein
VCRAVGDGDLRPISSAFICSKSTAVPLKDRARNDGHAFLERGPRPEDELLGRFVGCPKRTVGAGCIVKDRVAEITSIGLRHAMPLSELASRMDVCRQLRDTSRPQIGQRLGDVDAPEQTRNVTHVAPLRGERILIAAVELVTDGSEKGDLLDESVMYQDMPDETASGHL